jgi:hypothetical protein
MIDLCSRFVELAPLSSITAEEVSSKFLSYWICRYPRPKTVISDNGKQFLSKEFNSLLDSYIIEHTYSTEYNPQGNSMVERIHGVINNAIRSNPHWFEELQQIAWSLRVSYHRILQCSPSEIAFGIQPLTGSILDRSSILQRANENKDAETHRYLSNANFSRCKFEFKVGNYVYYKTPVRTKTAAFYEGPYKIVSVNNANNTLQIDKGNYLVLVNFRRVKPFKGEKSECRDIL